MQVVCAVRNYHLHGKLVTFRLHPKPTDFGALVFFEAMLELACQGWSHVPRKSSKNTFPYKMGEAKIWYFGDNSGVHYLHTLLLAENLFKLGLESIFHGQPSAYYKTLVFMMKNHPSRLNEVLPNQPLAYYKLLRKSERKGGPPLSSFGTGTRTMLVEVEEGSRARG